MKSEIDIENTIDNNTNSNVNNYYTTEEDNGGFGFDFDIPSEVRDVLFSGVLALISAILIFIFIVKTGHIFKNKILAWIKEYLNFRSILIESILKFVFLFLALFITFISFTYIPEENGGILKFLGVLIGGNLSLRIAFEFILMGIMLWKNTSDIAKYSEIISKNYKDKDNDKSDKKNESKIEEAKVDINQVPSINTIQSTSTVTPEITPIPAYNNYNEPGKVTDSTSI